MSARRDVLTDAAELIDGQRNLEYGPPSEDFTRTAAMWTAILGVDIESWQVAACLIAVKLSRLTESPHQRDHWVDAAGYAACGWECVEPETIPDDSIDWTTSGMPMHTSHNWDKFADGYWRCLGCGTGVFRETGSLPCPKVTP